MNVIRRLINRSNGYNAWDMRLISEMRDYVDTAIIGTRSMGRARYVREIGWLAGMLSRHNSRVKRIILIHNQLDSQHLHFEF